MLKCFLRISLYLTVALVFSAALADSYAQFFRAIKTDDDRSISQLLQRGFDVNTPSDAGEHPLLIAIRADAAKVIALLLAQKSLKPDERNAQTETPLMLAAIQGNKVLAQALIKRDADVNKTGWTPLHYAATGGHAEIVRLLLDEHAYIDAESPNKSTPLMVAAMYGNARTVELLLAEGADWRLKNEKDMTALDFAQQGQRPDAAKLLIAAAAAPVKPAAPLASERAASSPAAAASARQPLSRGSW